MRRIAAIILNYNSNNDLFNCIQHLLNQEEVKLQLIIVDNCSTEENINELINKIYMYDSEVFITESIDNVKNTNCSTYLILNNENRGYSAGNNIGLRLANKLNTDASLIINPDVIIQNPLYIKKLSEVMFERDKCFVCASKIIDINGKDQNPLRESSFLEEFTWFRTIFKRWLKTESYIISCNENITIPVPKVSGCCLLLKNDFLKEVNYLDEKVFLYCEEPILASIVKNKGGLIYYVPMITAEHRHIRSKKANDNIRMLEMIKSRKYYLKNYSNYSTIQLKLLDISYGLLSLYYKYKLTKKGI